MFHRPRRGETGKGDVPRPRSPEYDKNFDRVYGTRCRLHHAHTEECEGYGKETTSNQSEKIVEDTPGDAGDA